MDRRQICALVAIVLGALTFTAGAQANPSAQVSYAGQHAAAPRLVAELEAVAQAYWQTWGVALPASPQVWIAPDASLGAGGRGQQPGSQVWLSESEVVDLRAPGGWVARWSARVVLCDTYLHERGHNAGLGHDVGGVMGGEAAGTPPRCEAWAYSHAHAPRPRFRRGATIRFRR